MIRTEFDQITLQQYKLCTLGNTLVLHSGFKMFRKKKIQTECDEAYLDISDRLNDEMESQGGNTILRMWKKLFVNITKLKIYLICYRVQSLIKDQENIDLLAQNGFIYNEKLTHVENLYRLSGEIDRLKSITGGLEKSYNLVTKDANEIKTTIEDVIMTINNAATCNLSLNSTLADFVAANKMLKKIEKLNKK